MRKKDIRDLINSWNSDRTTTISVINSLQYTALLNLIKKNVPRELVPSRIFHKRDVDGMREFLINYLSGMEEE